jgi:hypothetical protein
MTIVEAAIAVLREAMRPMTTTEIYSVITAKGLYGFKAKHPVQVLHQQLRRHCAGAETAVSAKVKVFTRVGDDQFALLSDASSGGK